MSLRIARQPEQCISQSFEQQRQRRFAVEGLIPSGFDMIIITQLATVTRNKKIAVNEQVDVVRTAPQLFGEQWFA
ncbi:hypothetical protein ATE71_18435 [Sphingopyxis sp. H115]|nr:hypothetical protein ATE71_18435 [Sphingopyxis sp. H115]